MSKPKPRTWTVDERVVTDPNTGEQWVELDRQECMEAYMECEAIQRRLGGAILIVPDREEQPDGTFRTRRLVLRWESYVPARRAEPTPAADVEPVEGDDDLLASADEALEEAGITE